MTAWSVLIVEDEPMVRGRISRAIEHHPNLTLLAAVGSCADARAVFTLAPPQVLLVDIGLPDGDGVELIREVTTLYGTVDVMVITVFGDEKHVLAALKAGATGYLLKDSAMEDIGEAVMQLVQGGSPISPPIARYLLKHFRQSERETKPEVDIPILTNREREVLNLIVKGFSYKEIATLLRLSLHTVPSHIKSLYGKLAVHSRSEAVFEAIQTGLVEFDD
jgi:DNA-binding NarL/FixJ family response regulator